VGDDVTLEHVAGEGEGDGRTIAAITTMTLTEDGQRPWVMGVRGEHGGDSLSEERSAVGVEQTDGASHHTAEIAVGCDPPLEEGLDTGDFRPKAVTALEVRGSSLELGQLPAMGRILNPLVSPPAARVTGNELVAVEKSQLGVGCHEGHGSGGVAVGHRVSIGVESDEGCSVDMHGADLVRGGHDIRQGKQTRLLVSEHLRDRALRPAGVLALVGNLGEKR
jgi:hypothetical protein